MTNRTLKPKLSAAQLVTKMETEKGIHFKYTSKSNATEYLSDVNNYLRTAAYRKIIKNIPKVKIKTST